MTGRPVDWSPLADSDPVPGDPVEVTRLARRYAQTAESIGRLAANLGKLANGADAGWDSDAGRKFASGARDLAGRITKAHDRYAAAAFALRRWATPLETAQQDADSALAAARIASATMNANQPTAATSTAHTPSASQTAADTADATARQAADQRRKLTYDAASNDLAVARRRFDVAVDGYRTAARRIAHDLRAVIDHDPVHDRFLDDIGSWIHDHAEAIKTVLKIISYVVTALAVTALVIGLFVPGLDIIDAAALAALVSTLETSATVGIAAMTIGHSVLASTGDGSWLDVGIDLVALATFGVGRVAAKGAESTVEAAKTVAADAAEARATSAVVRANAQAVRRYAMINRVPLLRTVLRAQGNLDRMAAQATGAGAAARSGIESMTGTTTMAARVSWLSGEWAARVNLAQRLQETVPGVPQLDSAMSSIVRAGRIARLSTATAQIVDGASHIITDGVPAVGDFMGRHTTYPLIRLP